ncbi:MAG: RNA 2',3'-cyclic phosphodiesterase [Bacteroidia bacterium]|nr:RNA 2',3'-cyclic phosphodiesterase [Bacteroidia bacterium]
MRLFVGLPLPPEGVGWILRHRPLLLPAGARWIPPDQWHVTLVFIGNKTGLPVEKIHHAIQPLLQGHSAIRLYPSHLGWQRRTLWVHFHPAPILEPLVRELHTVIGLPLPDSYHPHVTIARSKHPLKWQGPVLPDQPEFLFTTAHLYQSILKPEGSEYISIHRYLFDVSLPR